MITIALRVFFISVILAGFNPLSASAQKRFALLFGNTGYENISPLSNPIRDVELVAGTLQEAKFDVRVVKDATKDQMDSELNAFIGKLSQNPGSVSLVYFAGHGLRSNLAPETETGLGDTYNYILGVNFNEADKIEAFQRGALRVDGPGSLTERLKASRSIQNYLIIDACRNDFNPRSTGVTRGFGVLKADEEASDTFFVFATRPGEFAMDGPADGSGNRNSPFAKSFAESIRVRGHGLSSLMPTITVQVRSMTGGAQTPWAQGTEAIRFSFFDSVSGTKESPDDKIRKSDEAFWSRVRESRSILMVSSYMDIFGENALYRQEAAELIERLKQGLSTDITARADSPLVSLGMRIGQPFAGGAWKIDSVDDASVFGGKFRPGDELYKINGQKVSDMTDPASELANAVQAGRSSVIVLRNNRPYTVNIR